MKLIRIGEKLINRNKIEQKIDSMLDMRVQGFSQTEVAKVYATDRAFISRLESLGEIRKGGKVAIVAFPISNAEEILQLANKEGIDFSVLFSETERWEFVRSRTGAQLLNDVMAIVAKLRENDVVIVAASDMRIRSAEALLDKQVVGISIGESPIEEDKYLDPQLIADVMQSIKGLG